MMYTVDVYMQRLQSSTGASPAELWERAIAESRQPMPRSIAEVRKMFAAAKALPQLCAGGKQISPKPVWKFPFIAG